MANSFDKIARIYDIYSSFQKCIAYQLLFGVDNKFIENTSILDLGCGSGHIVEYLCSNIENFRVIGIDISPQMCQVSENKFYSIDSSNIGIKSYKTYAKNMENLENAFYENANFVISSMSLHWVNINKILNQIWNQDFLGFALAIPVNTSFEELQQLVFPYSLWKLPSISKLSRFLNSKKSPKILKFNNKNIKHHKILHLENDHQDFYSDSEILELHEKLQKIEKRYGLSISKNWNISVKSFRILYENFNPNYDIRVVRYYVEYASILQFLYFLKYSGSNVSSQSFYEISNIAKNYPVNEEGSAVVNWDIAYIYG